MKGIDALFSAFNEDKARLPLVAGANADADEANRAVKTQYFIVAFFLQPSR